MALTQLVSRGAQDAELTVAEKPATSSFLKIYKKCAPYAIESIQQHIDGTIDWGQRIASTIRRNGDMILGMHLEIDVVKGNGTSYYPAERIIDSAELWLGKTKFETLTGDWLRCRNEIFGGSSSAKAAYKRLTDFAATEQVGTKKTLYLPLPFYFHDKPDLAIPLIAGQYHDVEVYINIANSASVSGVDSSYAPTIRLYVDYAFLGTIERRIVAQSEHQMLVEQLQYEIHPIAIENVQKLHKIELSFNHPCKWLAWHFGNVTPCVYTSNSTGETDEVYAPLADFKLTLNGADRFSARSGSYFNALQPYQFIQPDTQLCSGLYLYSFSRASADKNMDHADSSLNFSRIDSAIAQFTTKAANVASAALVADTNVMVPSDALNLDRIYFYTSNWQTLIVKSGMYALRYAN
jgi:hypothetical protein